MTTELLVATNDDDLYRSCSNLLAELDGINIVARATDGRLLGAFIERYQPQVVLLDEEIGPLPAIDMARQLNVAHPSVGLVLLADDDGPASLRLALAAGVRGLVDRNLDLTLLQGAIDSAANWSEEFGAALLGTAGRSGTGGLLLAMAGAKGGVGVTSIAVSLALQALRSERAPSVCLVDFDLQAGDVPAYLDLVARRSVSDLLNLTEAVSSRHLDETLYRHESGLRVLLAPPDGEDGEDVDGDTARQILAALKARFDVVLVDCGSVLNEAGASAVELADKVVIVGTPDVPAILGARRLLELWERLELRPASEVSLVLNRVSRHSEVQPKLVDKVASATLVETALPARFKAHEKAVNLRDPERMRDRRSRRAMARLSCELGLVAPSAGRSARGGGRSRRRSAEHSLENRGVGASGQVALESVAAMFMGLLLLLAVFQTLVVGYTMNLAGQAARAGARAAAVGESADAGARDRLPGASAGSASVSESGGRVTVTIPVPVLATPVFSPFSVSGSSGSPIEDGA
jgi:pilus assembly protein CpaE